MLVYFQLQLKLFVRIFKSSGFPIWATPIFIILLIGLMASLLDRYAVWSAYLIGLVAIQVLFLLNEQRRNDFLQNIYNKKRYYAIRTLENTVVAFPFCCVLIIYKQWLVASILLIAVLLLTLFKTSLIQGRAIPTPFTKKPFEHILGFRNNWLLIALLYSVTLIATYVGNLNLGIFALVVLGLVCTSFYFFVEDEFTLSQYSKKANQFLYAKIKRAIVQSYALLFPAAVALTLRFKTDALWMELLVALFVLLIVAFVICLKYAAYPRTISLPEMTVFALCCVFYPLIIAILPYYYIKAVNNLQSRL